MATKAVAMPAAVWKKRRRDRPFFLPYSSASAFMRASTFFCRSVCGTGMNSSLETTCVGTGVGLALKRAGVRLARSSSLNMPMAILQGIATEAGLCISLLRLTAEGRERTSPRPDACPDAGDFQIKEKSSSETRHRLGPERLDGFHQDRVWNQAVVGVAEHPVDGLAFLL